MAASGHYAVHYRDTRTPRVACSKHGVKVIELPWASKSSRFTLLFEAFAIDVLKAAKSIKDAQGILRLSWYQTQQIMAAPFEKAIRELLPYADVVFDKFHVEKHLNESVQTNRATGATISSRQSSSANRQFHLTRSSAVR